MKTSTLLILVLVVLVALLAWWKLPGLRHRVNQGIEGVVGWTEEARRNDPVGFIEYAQERLGEDAQAFDASLVELADARLQAEQELERNQQLQGTATGFAEEYRATWTAAEGGGGWPVEVHGQSYDQAQLVEQVKLILLQKNNYEEVIGELQSVLEMATARQEQLRARINSTRATLVRLESQKAVARVDEITGRADELLDQVDELLGSNRNALEELRSPVRTIEEILQAEASPEATGAGDEIDAMAFLQGGQ